MMAIRPTLFDKSLVNLMETVRDVVLESIGGGRKLA